MVDGLRGGPPPPDDGSRERELLPGWIKFLRRYGADGQPHSEASLIDHLVGTREILIGWGARPVLCRAGLFHSVYGTESFRGGVLPWTRRPEVRAEIGVEAERLAYLFGAMTSGSVPGALGGPDGAPLYDRFTGRAVPLSAGTWRDLFELTAANALEQLPRLPAEISAPIWEATRRLIPHLSPGARRAVDSAGAVR